MCQFGEKSFGNRERKRRKRERAEQGDEEGKGQSQGDKEVRNEKRLVGGGEADRGEGKDVLGQIIGVARGNRRVKET